jgi:uncharacterized membrane protein YsdA (DUF1294 family)
MLDLIAKYPAKALAAAYFLTVSLVAIIITVYDKKIAGSSKRRVPEATLLAWSALGGSVAMLLTMILIKHKTLHNKFMIGIPLIMLLQALAIFGLFYFGILS